MLSVKSMEVFMGLGNKFEQAQAMMGSPKVFLAEVSRDGRYAGNKRIMALIKELLDGFRRYAGYAVLSGLKGLNPFRKDAEMVDVGYYDFKKTPEYKQTMSRLAAELGITEEYFQEETLKKYETLRGYVAERFGADCEGLAEMELTGKGMFSFRADGTSFLVDVVEEDVYQDFGQFLAKSRDYQGFRLEEIGCEAFQGYRFMDANNEVYKAFLAKSQKVMRPGKETVRPKGEGQLQSDEGGEKGQKPQADERREAGQKQQADEHGKETQRSQSDGRGDAGQKSQTNGQKTQSEPETGDGRGTKESVGRAEKGSERKTVDGSRTGDAGNPAGDGENRHGERQIEPEKQLIWMDEFVFEKDGDSVILKRYRGKDSVVAVPSVIEADGKEFPVVGVWDKAFLGTTAEHVWLDAGKIRWEEWNPVAMRSGEKSFLQVHWRNLSPKMEKMLKENRKWAELELQHPSMFKDLMEGFDAVPESPRKKHSLFERWREKRAMGRQAAVPKRERKRPDRKALDKGVSDAGRQDRKISVGRKKNRGMDI